MRAEVRHGLTRCGFAPLGLTRADGAPRTGETPIPRAVEPTILDEGERPELPSVDVQLDE